MIRSAKKYFICDVLVEIAIAVVTPRVNRIEKPDFDEHIYKERHKVENLFEKLRRFRRIATSYEKLVHTFAAMVTIAYAFIWMKM